MYDQEPEGWTALIDDLVVMSTTDGELAEGLAWIDIQSRRKGTGFYKECLTVFRKYSSEKKAKAWLQEKSK